MMVFFNDPVPVTDPAARAVRMVLVMRDRLAELTAKWRRRGFDLGLALASRRGMRRSAQWASRDAGTTVPSAT